MDHGKEHTVAGGEERFLEYVQDLSIANNPTARIQNPLKHIHKTALLEQVEDFVHKAGLEAELEIFKKGALVAQKPFEFENIAELDDEDRDTLRDEVQRKWHQPRAMWVTTLVCSIGAAVQGWDQTGSNGANLSFPTEFGIASDSAHDRWLVGLINSAPPIAMLLLGVWCSDPVNNLVGRRGTIFISGWFALLSVLGSAFTQNWYQLLVCRLLLGLGMGLKSSTTSVFAAENAPAPIRGALTMTWQLYVAVGIFLGLSANLAVVDTGRVAWRLQLGSAFIPAVPLLAAVWFCPESPRWYIKKGRYVDAYKSLCRLRFTKLQAARDLFSMYMVFEAEKQLISSGGNGFRRFLELFTVPRIRRANLAAGTIMLAQQMCGINIIAFYSSTVFVEAGVSAKNALWVSWGFGLVQLIFAFPALWTIDTFGRRSLLLATFPHMAWTLLATGLCYLIPGAGTTRLALLALFIFLFAAFYAPGECPVCYPYAAEVFPLSHREIGMAWSVAVNAFGASILALTFPYMLVAFTPTGAFGFYCGLNILAFILIYLFVPETKALTLEELDYVFALPTQKFVEYEIKEALPYYVQRYLLWKTAKLRPLYDFSERRTLQADCA
ncbi:hypothetical protein H2200_004900 [Cladophialophora chaetospira]|uniref:Major facilitator superfamily (MFS) profile domain-containing protein n=1 Tax=Cladophialophora chaetospira TaxID=386627 RepID=A0AA39CKY6_9EURO|nr:hypothetical protein H2200_004900 [Cladophialophora chaetospira]